MRMASFHPRGRHGPDATLQVYLCPTHPKYLTGAGGCQDAEFEGIAGESVTVAETSQKSGNVIVRHRGVMTSGQFVPLGQQVIEMATIAGAAANRILDKVGTLTPGKEADIVVLDERGIITWPMNNVPGTIVTMMDPSHVRDVLIAGKVVYWKRQLRDWDIDRLLGQVEQARDRVLARINGPAKIGALPKGLNSFSSPYRPNFLGDCCFKGQNTTAPEYALRP